MAETSRPLLEIRDLSKAVDTELLVYGRLPLMLMENCVIKSRTGTCVMTCDPTCFSAALPGDDLRDGLLDEGRDHAVDGDLERVEGQ